jgi:hypothetical protein
MMKKLAVVLVFALVTVLVTAVAAQPSTYNSGYQVANLSSDPATISIQYVDQAGNVVATVPDTIPGDASTTYFPIGADPGFNGSVVISSDQPVAAIVNVLGDGFAFGEAYESFTQGAPTANLPLIMKGNFGFNTWFNVQNASAPGGDPVDVLVSYADTACTETATIPAGAAATFNQATNACLPTPYVGAATVTVTGGNGDVVAAVMQVGPTTLFAYNGFTGGSTEPVMPLVQGNNFGYFTGIQVQNTGSDSTTVTVSYVPGNAGNPCTQTETIAGGDSATFLNCSDMSVPTFVGGASVTANSTSQPLVAIVNQLNLAQGKGAAYSGFDPGAATDTVNFPLIMRDNFGFFTGFNVYNAGANTVTVNCVFSGTGAPDPVGATLASGETMTAVQTGSGHYVGSVQCNAPSGAIVGVANELSTAAGDNLFAYGGFNQ